MFILFWVYFFFSNSKNTTKREGTVKFNFNVKLVVLKSASVLVLLNRLYHHSLNIFFKKKYEITLLMQCSGVYIHFIIYYYFNIKNIRLCDIFIVQSSTINTYFVYLSRCFNFDLRESKCTYMFFLKLIDYFYRRFYKNIFVKYHHVGVYIWTQPFVVFFDFILLLFFCRYYWTHYFDRLIFCRSVFISMYRTVKWRWRKRANIRFVNIWCKWSTINSWRYWLYLNTHWYIIVRFFRFIRIKFWFFVSRCSNQHWFSIYNADLSDHTLPPHRTDISQKINFGFEDIYESTNFFYALSDIIYNYTNMFNFFV